VGDFMVLLDCGLSRSRAMMLNLASSAAGVVGGVAGYFALENAQHLTPYVLALAASSFIYIAVADLIPGLHRAMDARSTAWQIALIALGIVTVALPHTFLG
jgi:zinc and cadmium transporter